MARRVVQQRNVVVLGKTGGGKSTVANQILKLSSAHDGEDFRVSHDVLSSVTNKVKLKALVLQDGGMQYHVNVIDTIGLFDTSVTGKSQSEIQRMNDKVLRDLQTFMETNIPEGISLILFIYKQDRWTDEEQQTYECILKHFNKEISCISALIVTGCDGETEEKRRQVVSDFKRKKPRIAEFMQMGIYPVGFPDLSKLLPQLKDVLKPGIKKDRDVLEGLIFSADQLKLNVRSAEYRDIWGKMAALAGQLCTIL